MQPLGNHNKPHPCVHTDEVKQYIDLPFDYLNPVQSDFLPYLEEDNTNIIVASETSSGKTLIAELFAARAISLGKRVIYICPMKALADEKFFEWTDEVHTFSKYNVKILTGDIEITEKLKKSLINADIIILTPEMFNSKCRFFSKHDWLSNTVLVGDEIHLIGLDGRGDSEEVGIIQYFENSKDSRTLFLSATLPNVDDFGKWLDHMTGRPSILIKSAYRPCKLNKVFIEFHSSSSYAQTEENRMEKVIELVQKYDGESILIFVGAKAFGYKLSGRLKRLKIDHRFHSADLSREDKKSKSDDGTVMVAEGRRSIEEGFKNGDFNVLIATTTMAWGCVNGDTNVLTTNGYEKIDSINCNKAIAVNTENFNHKESGFRIKLVTDNKIPMKRIVLESGLSIVCTKDHVFPLINGNEKKASDIFIGDYLITDSIIPNKSCKNIENDICYLLGLIAGDGYVSEKSVDICCNNEGIKKRVIEIYKKNKISYRESANKFNGINHIVSRKEFRDIICDSVSYTENKYKILNYDLISLKNEENVFSIIAGLIDSDGSIDKNKICFYNTSYHLVNFFILSMKRFGIKTSVRLREPCENIIKDKKGNIKKIISKKKIYEVIVGSSIGFMFFKDNISKHMAFAKKVKKINILGENAYLSSISYFIHNENKIPVYGIRVEKTFNLLKKTCRYCIDNGPKAMSEILTKLNKKRLFMRESSFFPFFNIEENKIANKGRKRKHYYPNHIGEYLSNSSNINDFKKYLLAAGCIPVYKNKKIEKESRFVGEKVRYILKENSSEFVFDLSMKKEKYHHYVANGIVTHNCNTPARYVIQSHTKFGLTPMHPSNIIQSTGRAGRAGWSDKGDALIVCPQREVTKEARRIFSNYKISSTMIDANILMFHILSYIHDGTIKNSKDLFEWHQKTLASVQGQSLSPEKCSIVLDSLKSRGMVVCKEGVYKTTRLGEITARMYMSPLDVSDWFRNFAKLDRIKTPAGSDLDTQSRDNVKIAQALSRCYNWGLTWKTNKDGTKSLASVPGTYISEREKNAEEVLEYCHLLGTAPTEPNMKYAALFYRLLSGKTVGPTLNSYYMTISQDIERVISTLHQCDMKIGKYYHRKNPLKVPGFEWGNDWKNLEGRLKYGVTSDLADFVGIPGIGKKKAENLRDKGITSIAAMMNPENKDACERAIGKKTFEKTVILLRNK